MWFIQKIGSLFEGKSFENFESMGGYSLTQSIYGGENWKYKNFSQQELLELYKGWVFSCSDLIGDGMAWLDTALYKDKNLTDKIDHQYLKLLDSSFIKAITIYLKTIWAVYLYKNVVGGRVESLTILRSWRITEEKDLFWNVKLYKYFNGTAYFEFLPEDLIVFKTFSPLFEDTGMTPLKAVATQVAMDLSSVEYNRLFFENGGRPWTVLKHEKKIDDDVKAKYLAKWKANFVGLKNSNKVAFLDNGVTLEDFSANQKDMELVWQRTFTMDEVLMIFRVPKPLLWKSDGVGFADRRVPWYYFTEYNLKPFAFYLQEQLNKTLFKDIGYFAFNFSQDKEDLMKEYNANLITQNQYLLATWRQAFNEGDRLWDGTEVTIREEQKRVSEFETKLFKSIESSLEKGIKKLEFGTEDYNQKVWETKIKRTDIYETQMARIQSKIWDAQEKDIIKNLWSEKSFKEVKKESDLFNEKKYTLMYITLYTNFFTNLMKNEGKIAMQEISDEVFAISRLNKWIWENIDRMSTDIDKTTRSEIFEIIKQGNRDEVWVAQIATAVRAQFNQYTKKSWRIEKIVRSEITRASNKSQEQAYIQSGVVAQKEWYTATDERVCPFCNDLHKQRIWVEETFLKIGDSHVGEKITYEDVEYPPRHVNCRCTIRPIIARKSLKSFEVMASKNTFILNNNWIENE